MAWTFEISSGKWYDPQGNYMSQGYAGHGVGVNNVADEAIQNHGRSIAKEYPLIEDAASSNKMLKIYKGEVSLLTKLKQIYTDSILLIERLHRRFLDVVKTELDRLKIDDINNIQTLILYNINGEQLTIGELTNRGYYLGSNVSYNVKKLAENGYLVQEQAPHDKRSTRIKLSEKGLAICKKIDELYQRNIEQLGKEMDASGLATLNKTLTQLERFWTDYINNIYKIK